MSEDEQRHVDLQEYRELKDDELHEAKITDEKEEELMRQPIDTEVSNSAMNWFKIESKMRKIIHSILTPIVTRSHNDRKTMLKNEKNIGCHTKRIEQLEQFMFAVKEEDAM